MTDHIKRVDSLLVGLAEAIKYVRETRPSGERCEYIPAPLWPLAELMGDISQRCYCAGWMLGLEHVLYAIVFNGADPDYGMDRVTREEIETMRRIAEDAGLWIVWEKGMGSLATVLLSWYKARYD